MAAAADLPCYTLISGAEDEELMSEQDMKNAFEKGNLDQKVLGLKHCIKGMLKGEKYPMLLMFIIRFLLPMKDHIIKKLLLIYFEIVPKTAEGKLLPQMILVCDAYRKDLQSPNEYVRGSVLRFLCKLKEAELLEPLMPAIRACLEHRHSYVRRNAVLCIYTIYKNYDFLMPDAPEVIQQFLMQEQDISARRNAFMMLVYADRDRALDYLDTVMDQVQNFGDILQLIIVELVYKVCRQNPAQRARFIRCIYMLLNATSPAVRYEAAGTLLTLSSAPTAIQAAANAYMQLVAKESDNNVRLIVLQRIADMRNTPAVEKVLQGMVMDLLRVLSAPDLEVRKRTLEIVMSLVTARTVEEVLQVLKKEIAKTYDESETSEEYRRQLVKALHTCAVKFPEKAVSIVPILMEFIGDSNSASASDVITSVREAIEYFPELRQNIVEKLLDTFPHIKASNIYRAVMWILGEYVAHEGELDRVLATIRASIGEVPIVESELRKAAALEEEQANESEKPKLQQVPQTKTTVTADGTYITQSAFSVAKTQSEAVAESHVSLRTLMMEGDFFVAAVMSSTLAKLALKRSKASNDEGANNRFAGECMLIMASVLHLGKSGLPAQPIDPDSYERIIKSLRVLAEPSDLTTEIFVKECRVALKDLLDEMTREQRERDSLQKSEVKVQVDDCIKFAQLGGTEENQVDELEKSLALATGSGATTASTSLNKVVQLTGFGDPVYAEAYVNVNQYDITLDVLIVNQTSDTLQGLSLELATLGDLKLIERPATFTVGPRDFVNATASIKVSSTDTGIIFGTIVYDISGTTEHCVIVLNDIYIDVMDYIIPASCTETEFRAMWAEFEWENKVTVNTDILSLEEYTQHICNTTNMRCLTLESGKGGECGFYAANLYARSIFGEDALANLSIEKAQDGRILGHIRIRAKTQGIALSLGDKITLKQKSNKALPA